MTKWLDKLLELPGRDHVAANPREAEVAALVKAYLAEGTERSWEIDPRDSAVGAKLLDLPSVDQIVAVKHALKDDIEGDTTNWYLRQKREKLVSEIMRRSLPFTPELAREIFAVYSQVLRNSAWPRFKPVPKGIARTAEAGGWLSAVREEFAELVKLLASMRNAQYADARKMVKELELVVAKASGHAPEACRIEHDAWGDKALAALEEMDEAVRNRWQTVLNHCASAKGSAPSAKWLKSGKDVVERFGAKEFVELACAWLGMLRESFTRVEHAEERTLLLTEANGDVLKGIVWLLVHVPEERVASALNDAAVAAFKKIPNFGSRSTKAGNACLQTLKNLPGLLGPRQLAALRASVKQPSHKAAVEKALAECAERLHMSLADTEELATPDHGFVDGKCKVAFGAALAELSADGLSVRIAWSVDGKPQKSEPAQVKRDFADQRKALKRLVADVEKTLAAVRDRLERLPMGMREWPVQVWRERYLDHPIVGTLARRLIWRFRGAIEKAGLWVNGRWIDESGSALDIAGTTVLPWHPVFATSDSVRAWRAQLAAHEVVQPFKQAHREIYLLTDAERNTRTYSNRFAAHVLRQHQFATLCLARGWKYRLQGDFDSHNTPTLELPQWNLSAEFWVEAPGNQGERSGMGIYLHVLTDQVRFRPLVEPAEGQSREPLPLEEIPQLVFSEVMRDVDLFVGVTSVGNDPTWNDGGPGGHFRAYWNNYSFGDLSVAAETRKEIIAELLPRLSLREVAHIDGKFLVVKGTKRTYKVHLGSGNVLMLPNDQYLCIVPDRSPKSRAELHVPFEGDTVLAVILSKALLLARDDLIRDTSITRQIETN